MRFNILVLTTILSASFLFVGCGGGETPSNSVNRNASNAPANSSAVANSKNPLGTTKAPEAATSNNAPTLAPVVEGYYAALQKKDEAGVKRFLSQAALKYNEAAMKEEKKSSLLVYLEESEAPVAEKREVRNEKIEGDTAIAEIKGGSLGTWTPIAFVKENGEWKFDSAEKSFKLQDIPKTGSNSTAGK